MKRPSTLIATLAGAALVLAGCGSSSTGGTSTSAAAPSAATSSAATSAANTAALSGELKIYAAASLKKAFDKIRTSFQAANPGLTIPDIEYNGSSTLVTQIQGGAQVDVFASADIKNMDKVKDLVDTPVEFATNTLQIAVQPGNPRGIKTLADLAKPGITVVLCADGVPCGTAAQTALKAAGVTVKPVSEEQSVTDVLNRVISKNVDAGLVYTTDVKGAAGKVDGIAFAEAAKAVNHYPIAGLKASKNPDAAAAFIAYVSGPDGQQVLAELGFGRPGA